MNNNTNVQFDISSENQLASILPNFDDGMIYNIINYNLANTTNNLIYKPNIISSLEQQFKLLEEQLGANDIIKNRKEEMYINIINTICAKYDMQVVIQEDTDLYTLAYYIYDVLVLNIYTYFVEFLSRYIIQEKSTLYKTLGFNENKKAKDSTTLYSKKIYKNDLELGIIHANIHIVLPSLAYLDMTFADFISMVLAPQITDVILHNVIGSNNFYRSLSDKYILNINNSYLLCTDVRLNLQEGILNIGGIEDGK